jgi:hypothetical protein
VRYLTKSQIFEEGEILYHLVISGDSMLGRDHMCQVTEFTVILTYERVVNRPMW